MTTCHRCALLAFYVTGLFRIRSIQRPGYLLSLDPRMEKDKGKGSLMARLFNAALLIRTIKYMDTYITNGIYRWKPAVQGRISKDESCLVQW